MTGTTLTYQTLLWRDALVALSVSRPFKSVAREDLEKRLLAKRYITEFRIRENEMMIQKVASRRPVTIGAQAAILGGPEINGILANLEQTATRIDQLFTRPKAQK